MSDTFNDDFLECHYCGHEDKDAWELDADDGKTTCPSCGREFLYSRNPSVTYSAKGIVQ